MTTAEVNGTRGPVDQGPVCADVRHPRQHGTGGTIVGVGQCLRERNRSCRVVVVEPNESCTLMCAEVGRHLIEGISDGFVPRHLRPAPAHHRRDGSSG